MTKNMMKRCMMCIMGLFIAAIGVAITKKAALGVSPISSVANVVSMKYMSLSLGNCLIIWNCILILGQFLLLRSKFQVFELLQIPLSFLFGWFTDFGLWLVSSLEVQGYISQILMVILGTIVLGLGISMTVIADVIMNSGEAFVKALSQVIKKEFGNVKIVFDVSCVVLAVGISLVLFDAKIVGTREGTIIAALLTGVVVKFFINKLNAPLGKLLREQ